MHLSKLTTALQALNQPQLKRLKEYVHSPYFKVPAAAVSLFNYLYAQYPSFPEKKIQPKAIARKTSNLPTASVQSWAGTELLRAIEQFIGLEFYRQNKWTILLHQMHGFHQLGLAEHFRKDLRPVLQQLDQCPVQHTDTFYLRHLLAELDFNQRDLLHKPATPSDITPAVTLLDEFYALKKLRYLCEARMRKQLKKKVFPPQQINTLLKTLQPYHKPKYPYPYLLLNIHHLLNARTYAQSQPYYRRLKEYAAASDHTESKAAFSEAISYIMHHCLHWYGRGYEEAGKEYLWWVELKMKYGRLPEGKTLKPATFRNIVLIAVNHKSAEWLQQFIKDYAHYLKEEEHSSNYAFANGLLCYRLKKYKESIRCLLMAQAKTQPLFNCLIRRWQFICSYECDGRDTEGLENHLLSFEKYLTRHKPQLAQHKKAFDKFIQYAGGLLISNHCGAPKSLLNKLDKEESFPGKHWIIHQFTLKNTPATIQNH